MDLPRPLPLLVVPADWEAVPEDVTDLRRCLCENYGGRLVLKMESAPPALPAGPLLRAVGPIRAAPRPT
ncbi:hypothetical protein [Deinococcus humi]|uniref:Uncharacterized protein n=1 Tax=Deinococcus humi TaxID=662880 RepID=A0A7W8JWJ0_9DEIO|nr:hypothetical protein [Deinococcus humi]MBB5364505.1 hypothetical protein [Deinococcus humi]GGO37958.1 hypothetical protein GCM10008949_43850 [Deinococcus humi]